MFYCTSAPGREEVQAMKPRATNEFVCHIVIILFYTDYTSDYCIIIQ